MELLGISFPCKAPATTVGALKEELDERKGKIDASAIESALPTLQRVIARPAALFDPYAVITALDEVVNVTKERKDEREFITSSIFNRFSSNFQHILRTTRQSCLLSFNEISPRVGTGRGHEIWYTL